MLSSEDIDDAHRRCAPGLPPSFSTYPPTQVKEDYMVPATFHPPDQRPQAGRHERWGKAWKADPGVWS